MKTKHICLLALLLVVLNSQTSYGQAWSPSGTNLITTTSTGFTGSVGIGNFTPTSTPTFNHKFELFGGDINLGSTRWYRIDGTRVLGVTATGGINTHVGFRAGDVATGTPGSYNVFAGFEAGLNNTEDFVTLLGYQAGKGNTGEGCTFVGYQTGFGTGPSTNSGYYNTFVGSGTGRNNTSGGGLIHL